MRDQRERESEEAGALCDHEAGLNWERRRGRKRKGVTPKGSEKVSARPTGSWGPPLLAGMAGPHASALLGPRHPHWRL